MPTSRKLQALRPCLFCFCFLAGSGDSLECVDKKKAKGSVCNNDKPASPCMLGGVCDGSSKKCPKIKKASIGTPCNRNGLFAEAVDANGKVAVKGKISQAAADAHGWSTCQRCYEGECQDFRWE
jgi:hypothetical protein